MATTLPIVQASNATTYSLSYLPGSAYLTIPYTSFTAGRRYLIIATVDVLGYYDGSYRDGGIAFKYNGNSLNMTASVLRSETTKFTSVSCMQVYSIPAGAGTGLELWGYWINSSGAQIKNQRIIAIDLDVNNTDFPQQSVNGWQYAAVETPQALTTSWAPYVSIPNFTPDGSSKYLIIVSGYINAGSGASYLGIRINGVVSPASYHYSSAVGSPAGAMICSTVVQLPTVLTTLQLVALTTIAGSLSAAHIVAIRLDTFTKQAGTQVASPTVVSGTAWQSAASITPSPAPVNGEDFLVFSRVQGYTWVSGDATLSERILRNPGSTQVIVRNTANLVNSLDYLGPTLCWKDTADGVNSWELQFKREDYVDRPLNIYNATLVAVKAEVGYTNIIDATVQSDIVTTATTTATVASGVNVEIISPQNNATNVSPNIEIVFRAYDDTPIVDLANINVYQVLPNYVPVMIAGEFQPGWSGEIIEDVVSQDYTIVIIPPSAFDSGVRVQFMIEYEDL